MIVGGKCYNNPLGFHRIDVRKILLIEWNKLEFPLLLPLGLSEPKPGGSSNAIKSTIYNLTRAYEYWVNLKYNIAYL